MSRIHTPKHASIVQVVAALAKDLGDRAVRLKDHWEADLHAIGLSATHDPMQLAYISTWQLPEGHYFLQLQSASPEPGIQTPQVVGTWSSLPYDELCRQIGSHFTANDSG